MRFPPYSLARIAAAVALSFVLSACSDSPEKLLEAARQHLEKKDPVAASIELKNALAKNPDLAEARFLLGQALLESGDPANAEVELRKAADLKYNPDKVAVLMARSLLGRGQFKKLVDDYAAQEPGDAGDRAKLKTSVAIAYAAQGKLEPAEKAFAAALAAKPEYAPALLGQARLKLLARDVAGAQSIIDGVLARDPKDTDALMFRAGLQNGSNQREAALATYRAVLAVRADHAGAHSALILASLQEGKLDQAQQQFDAMKQVLSKSSQTTYLQGLLAYQQKNLPLAKESVQGLLKIAGNDPRVLQLAGAIEFESRSDLQAQEYLSQALARAPEMEFGRRLLVRSYLRTGQTAKAVAAMQPVVDAVQPSASMLALAGEVYMQAGDAGKAETYFSRASQLDPENTKNRTALAMIHAARGDQNRGMSELEEIAAGDSGTSADMALIATSLSQKRYDQALKAIAAMEKKQPDNLGIHNMRAAALLGKGDAAAARKSLEHALSLNPTYFPAAAALARLDLDDKKPEQAAQRFESLLAKDAKNVQALLALAELRSRAGAKREEVTDLIKRAVAAAPADPAPRVALISYHLGQKDAKAALVQAQEALQSMPERPELLDVAGRSMQEAGDLTQAAATYNKLITLLPNTAQPHLRLAEVQLAANNREAARETLARGLRALPEAMPLQRAMIIMDAEDKRYADALSRARSLQKQQPKQVMGYLLEGDVLAMQQMKPEAVAAYRNGLAKVGDSSELAVRLYAALQAGGQTAEASKHAEVWLKAHPKDHSFRLFLASAAIARKDYPAAAAYYRRILEDQPNSPVVLNDLAWVLGQQGDPKAMGYAERANRIAPRQPALMDTLAMLLVQKGDTAKGIALLREALVLAPQAGGIRLNLARALIKSGDKSGARGELESLAKLGDKFTQQVEVGELLKQL